MTSNIERFRTDLDDLQQRGMLLECCMIRDTKGEKDLKAALPTMDAQQIKSLIAKLPSFKPAYELWYSECLALIKQVLPDRLDAFVRQYERAKSRKEITFDNYVIEDYMIGLTVSYGDRVRANASSAIPKLQNQTAILAAVKGRFESSLFEIRQLVQADLFDSEISSARHLLKNKFLRAAGAVAGVVLEKHLKQVCVDHKVQITKKNPGISDLNQHLRDAGAIDVPQWRHITLLGDLRNLCDHSKATEPSHQQVADRKSVV